MIGWTKHRKRCPEHGLVLRKEDEYSHKANYCPACGKQLTVVSVPYLFQVYFHPAIMIVPGILLFFGGLFMFLDIQGCIQEGRSIAKLAAAERENLSKTLPEDWQVVYSAVEASGVWNQASYTLLRDYLKQKKDKKLSRLTGDEVKMFMNLMPTGKSDDAFELITKNMRETR